MQVYVAAALLLIALFFLGVSVTMRKDKGTSFFIALAIFGLLFIVAIVCAIGIG